jgi:isoleucyl-tRNA synthetase
MSTETPNYKDTLTITSTDFPQKAQLATNEPLRMEHWKEIDLEKKIAEKRRGATKYVLHDGPPYANGDIHLGHALNKTLKDIVVRYRTMCGFASTYIPGFDCHGLPIEQKVIESVGLDKARAMPPVEIRKLCHAYATRYIGLQSDQFKRLGVGGEWDTPYLTLDPKFEVGILEGFRNLVEKGLVYKGFKPVYWDSRYQTALAEAEIEYEDHTSPSIYVRFPILNPGDCAPLASHGAATIVIWTTTPWTLPGNLAVCVHPQYDYVLAQVGEEKLVIAKDLLDGFLSEAKLGEAKVLEQFKGDVLEHLECSHPLLDKTSVVLLGEHVTLEQGTGCVHTAPGHGVEDFEVCQKYGIPVIVPVDERGCYTDDYPEMKGQFVQKCNEKIIDLLRDKGLLVHRGNITHQYPYSWRSHEPVIYRATAQWFMSLEKGDIRKKCLEAIDSVQWVPSWGRDRIYNMMATRPDWCLSRQRAWGVPIPSLYSVKAKQSILVPEVVDRFIEKVAVYGTDCWFTMPVEEFLPEGFVCPVSGGTEFEKENDILDVWFDSGSSHISVLEKDERLASPADLYLEGSDQHRGWFMSSMLVSMGARDRAPYKTVLTHGFLLDGKGQAMSKSKGNVISPLDIIKEMGADVLRLWVVSEDYRTDVAASKDIFKQTMETYRRIRNTMRFLLGNLVDFDPKTQMVPVARRSEIDRWAMAVLARLIERVAQGYETFEFHKIYHAVHQFCVVHMSALYLDILKDRLYCSAPDDEVRRSAQSTLWEVFSALVRMLAPVMPFTTDEAYTFGRAFEESVHLEDFPVADPAWKDDALMAKWDRLLAAREACLPVLEAARRDKAIGKSLDAAVAVRLPEGELATLLTENKDLFRDILIVSQCEVVVDSSVVLEENEMLRVDVHGAEGGKCARCWSFTPTVGEDAEHPQLCRRCSDAVRRLL